MENRKTIAFIFAHPDDEAIPFGLPAELAQKGHAIHLIALTDGSLGTHDHLTRRQMARLRRKEFAHAAEILGATPHIIGIPDGDVNPFSKKQKRKLLRTLREVDPDIAVIHNHDDYHTDHVNGNTLTKWALFHRPDGSFQTRRGLFHRVKPSEKPIAVYEADTQGSQTWQSVTEDTGRHSDHLSKINMILEIGSKAIEQSTQAFTAHQSQLSPREDGKLGFITLAVRGAQRRGKQAGFPFGVGLTFIPFGGYAFSSENTLGKLFSTRHSKHF